MWIESCSFLLCCDDADTADLIGREINRTALYIRENIKADANLSVSYLVNPDKYITYCLKDGKIFFDVYDENKDSLNLEGTEDEVSSELFALATHQMRKMALAYAKKLREGKSVPQPIAILKKWNEFDYGKYMDKMVKIIGGEKQIIPDIIKEREQNI